MQPILAIALAATLAGQIPDASGAGRGSEATIDNCLVLLMNEADVPAQVPGLIESIEAREGLEVQTDQQVAQVNDVQAEMKKLVAETELAVATVQAENRINVDYAKASWAVAGATLRKNIEANRAVPGTIPQVSIDELRLMEVRARLGIKQAEMDLDVAKQTAVVRETEVQAADTEIGRHKIRSPLTGVVEKVHKHQGEWVQAGEPVLHVVQLDRLKVEGWVNGRIYSRTDVKNRPVIVHAVLPGGRPAQFRGKVTYVSQLVQGGGDFRISAEVVNERDPSSEEWMLQPGLEASMVINLNPTTARRGSPAVGAAPPASTR